MSLKMSLEERCVGALKALPDLFARPVDFFPDVSNRPFWENTARTAGGAGFSRRWADYSWPPLTASLFRRFRTDGDRSGYEKIHFERRKLLGDILTDHLFSPSVTPAAGLLLDALWAICEESFWGLSAHNAVSGVEAPDLCDVDEPIVDLFAAETAALLSWALHLAGPSLEKESPLTARRVLRELRYRIVMPFLERTDFWWMGENSDPGRRVNNWNPWIVSNVLITAALLEEFDAERSSLALKSCRLLDRFLAEYGADGGCDEGAAYWTKAGAALFDALEILFEMSGGRISAYDEPLIAEMGRYIRKVHIAGDFYVNFADGSAIVPYIPGDLIRRWGVRIKDKDLEAFGVNLARRQGRDPDVEEDVPESFFRKLHRMSAPADGDDAGDSAAESRFPDGSFGATARNESGEGSEKEPVGIIAALPRPRRGCSPHDLFGVRCPAEIPEILQSWLGDIQVMCARTSGNAYEGFFLAAKGGHNGENHNHNDVGSFLVYHAGEPVLIDIGVETYTAKTFGPERYSLWTMRSEYHNLPIIGGLGQSPGRESRAENVVCRLEEDFAELSLDIGGAYPKEAGIRSWNRLIRLDRAGGGRVRVCEDFTLENPSAVVFVLMTPWRPLENVDGGLLLFDGPGEGRSEDGLAGNGSVTGEDEGGRAAKDHRGKPAALPLGVSDGFTIRVEDIPVTDSRLRQAWPPVLYRILLEANGPLKSGHFEFTLG